MYVTEQRQILLDTQVLHKMYSLEAQISLQCHKFYVCNLSTWNVKVGQYISVFTAVEIEVLQMLMCDN